MRRYVLSVIVDNHAGALSRVTGLFSRRGYNIDSLGVGETEDPRVSRITVTSSCDEFMIEQIIKQVQKLEDVRRVFELPADQSVYRELALVKIKVGAKNRMEILGIVDVFRANIVDLSSTSITVEITGDDGKITAFIELMEPFGVSEIARTGLIGLKRGV